MDYSLWQDALCCNKIGNSQIITEKIADCFATGTIPIYYGCKDIGKVFNEDGIIWLDGTFKIEDLSFDLYHSKMDAIKDNFNRIKNLPTAEDYIYSTYIKPIL